MSRKLPGSRRKLLPAKREWVWDWVASCDRELPVMQEIGIHAQEIESQRTPQLSQPGCLSSIPGERSCQPSAISSKAYFRDRLQSSSSGLRNGRSRHVVQKAFNFRRTLKRAARSTASCRTSFLQRSSSTCRQRILCMALPLSANVGNAAACSQACGSPRSAFPDLQQTFQEPAVAGSSHACTGPCTLTICWAILETQAQSTKVLAPALSARTLSICSHQICSPSSMQSLANAIQNDRGSWHRGRLQQHKRLLRCACHAWDPTWLCVQTLGYPRRATIGRESTTMDMECLMTVGLQS